MACFGIAAGIGAVRFAGGWQAELAALHIGASQLLGLAGSAALAVACLPGSGKWNHGWLIGAIFILAAAIFALGMGLIGPITLLAFAIGIAGSAWRSLRSGSSAWIPAGWILLLGNATLVRRAPWLAEAVAWHAYHFLIALALAIVAVGILRDATGSTLPHNQDRL
jgi:hypothetical protein